MKPPALAAHDSLVFSRRPAVGALASLFVMTLRQHIRGRRLLVVLALFVLPPLLAALANLAVQVAPYLLEKVRFALVFNMIPHALAPLAALLYAAGIVQDEVDEQTLTYLLVRPLPRWTIYVTKFLATLLLTCLLTAFCAAATLTAIVLTAGQPITGELVTVALKTSAFLSLALVAYCGLFGLAGLVMRRSLLIGAIYIILFEGVLASLDTVARRLTIMYYFRVMVLRELAPASGTEWSIDLKTAPDVTTCVWTLILIGAVATLLASVFFTLKEFRVKTPGGR